MSWTQAYSTFYMPKPCSSNIHTRIDVSGEPQVQYVAWGVGGPRNWTTNLLIGRWHCCQMKDSTQKQSADERGHAQMLSNRSFLSFLVFGSHRCYWRFTHRLREHFKSTKVSLFHCKTFYSCTYWMPMFTANPANYRDTVVAPCPDFVFSDYKIKILALSQVRESVLPCVLGKYSPRMHGSTDSQVYFVLQ